MFLSHIHVHRLESIVNSLQEMSLPFPGVSVLVLRWQTAALMTGHPTFMKHLLPVTTFYGLPVMMAKTNKTGIGFLPFCAKAGSSPHPTHLRL
jgi:hypothetical protein